jgi:hypothetical protein
MPVADTVASALLDDDQTAVDVTSCVVPSDIVAVALNWELGPALRDGADPVTLSDETVVAAVGVDAPPQAAAKPADAMTIASERFHSIMFCLQAACRRSPAECSIHATDQHRHTTRGDCAHFPHRRQPRVRRFIRHS